MATYVCCNCGGRAEVLLDYCPRCGGFKQFHAEVVRRSDILLRDTVIESSLQIRKRTSRMLDVGEYDQVVGSLPESRWLMVVYGEPFAGKTCFALRFVDVLAKRNEIDVLYNAIEEGGSPSFIEKLRFLEIANSRLFVTVMNDLESMFGVLSNYSVMVLDSYGSCHLNADDIARLMRECDVSIVLIMHVRRDGEVRGDSGVLHLADVIIEVQDRQRFRIAKNRYGQLRAGDLP